MSAGIGVGFLKAMLMWAYGCRLLAFSVTERIAANLRRFRWFREG